jgi:non-specific serine/threonine protein kinase
MPQTNLPHPTISYVKRTGEIARVQQRMGESRLPTVTGAGSCGKTRLAVEVGWAVLSQYPDGVCLIELAPVTDGTGRRANSFPTLFGRGRGS